MDLFLLGDLTVSGASVAENSLILLFAFLIGHALADFPLQGDFLAIGKERHGNLEKLTGTAWPRGMWLYCLTMHALIHGGAVWVVTGSVRYGGIEFGLHWIIDYAKSVRWTNFFIDQGLHVLCKVVYVYMIVWAGGG